MKNIHVLPTDKPSRLIIDTIENKLYYQSILHNKTVNVLTQNIYISNDEYIGLSYYLDGNLIRKGVVDDKDYWEVRKDYKKIILTTDQDLIKDGVQAIDDEFLEWFVENQSCEEVEVKIDYSKSVMNYSYKLIIPKEEPELDALNHFLSTSNVIVKDLQKFDYKNTVLPKELSKQETLEEYIERETKGLIEPNLKAAAKAFLSYGAKWQQERMYSEEEVKTILFHRETHYIKTNHHLHIDNWFEQFKKK